MTHETVHGRVLSIYLTTRGLGFVLMDAPLSPIDWGTREVRGKNKNAICLAKVAALLEAHQPDVLVLEDTKGKGARRATRIQRLSQAIDSLATDQDISLHRLSRGDVKGCFERFGAHTHYEIAMAIAKRIPAYERFLPPPRKLWMSEDPRMSIFAAAALAITFFDSVS
jgi:hypothetical protein